MTSFVNNFEKGFLYNRLCVYNPAKAKEIKLDVSKEEYEKAKAGLRVLGTEALWTKYDDKAKDELEKNAAIYSKLAFDKQDGEMIAFFLSRHSSNVMIAPDFRQDNSQDNRKVHVTGSNNNNIGSTTTPTPTPMQPPSMGLFPPVTSSGWPLGQQSLQATPLALPGVPPLGMTPMSQATPFDGQDGTVSALLLQFQLVKQQLAERDQQLTTVTAERDDLAQTKQKLSNVTAERDGLKTQVDRLREELCTVTAERDDLAQTKQKLSNVTAERDRLREELGTVTSQRDDLREAKESFDLDWSALCEHNAALKKQCVDTETELDTLKTERDDIKKERDNLKMERDRFAAVNEALKTERDNLNMERDGFAAVNEALRLTQSGVSGEDAEDSNGLARQDADAGYSADGKKAMPKTTTTTTRMTLTTRISLVCAASA